MVLFVLSLYNYVDEIKREKCLSREIGSICTIAIVQCACVGV